jgi:hypothetical protein
VLGLVRASDIAIRQYSVVGSWQHREGRIFLLRGAQGLHRGSRTDAIAATPNRYPERLNRSDHRAGYHRSRAHFALKQAETLAQGYRDKLADLECPSGESGGSARRVFLALGASEACHDVPASWRRFLLPSTKNTLSPIGPALNRQALRTDTEARIRAIAPDLQLPARLRKPNLVFSRGELPRLRLTMPHTAGRPLAIREMALGVLAAKGIRFPDRRTMKRTRVRLREVFAKLQARGVARTVGTGKATRRQLT